MRKLGMFAVLVIGSYIGSLLFAEPQLQSQTDKWRAMSHEDVVRVVAGPSADGHQENQFTRGLNTLAASGWEPVLFEPGGTMPIPGTGSNNTITYPSRYIFHKIR